MPVFEYVGIDRGGKTKKGVIDAESEKNAKLRMKEQGVFLTQIKKRGAGAKSAQKQVGIQVAVRSKVTVKLRDVANMTRQLSTLIKAHVPLPEALSAIREQQDDPKFKEVIGRVRDMVNEGSSLAKALSEYPRIFSEIYVSMIRAGESSGALDLVLSRLADFIENSVKLRSKVVSAMTYPSILGVVALSIIGFLMIVMVPKMTQMFQEQEKALPFITVLLIDISTAFEKYWFIILVMMGTFGFFFRKYIKTEKGREWFDGFTVRLPIFGLTIKKLAISRFSRTLSTLLASGVDLIRALDIVKEVVANVMIAKSIEEATQKVQEGESLAKKLKESGYFPPIVTHMIAIGEKSGGKELEDMLENVAVAYDSEVEAQLLRMTSIIEPLMIIVLGGFVAFVVLAIMLPILEMSNLG
jgi:general secretion pathway protein F